MCLDQIEQLRALGVFAPLVLDKPVQQEALDALRSSSEPGDLLVVSDNDLTDLESAIPASRVPVVAYL